MIQYLKSWKLWTSAMRGWQKAKSPMEPPIDFETSTEPIILKTSVKDQSQRHNPKGSGGCVRCSGTNVKPSLCSWLQPFITAVMGGGRRTSACRVLYDFFSGDGRHAGDSGHAVWVSCGLQFRGGWACSQRTSTTWLSTFQSDLNSFPLNLEAKKKKVKWKE